MSHELFYTSAPSGVKPGTKGFCTVACTSGIPAQLIDRLESLSGYRYLYEPGSPEAAKNPVSFAHWHISVKGRTRSVLSRVCDAGSDYSGRSNKFAHHVALEANELADCGPAFVLTRDFLEKTWTGAPRVIPTGRRIPATSRVGGVCRLWQQATGDAGWAGVLADSFVADPSKPAYVIYKEGINILALFEEALALLPETTRWQVTFNTYFTDLPAGLSCAWRGVIEGSPAARDAAKQGARALVIQLAKAGACTAKSPLVVFARTGVAPITKEVPQPVTEVPAELTDEVPGIQAPLLPQQQGELELVSAPLRKTPNVVIVEREVASGDGGRGKGFSPAVFVASVSAAAILFGGLGVWIGMLINDRPAVVSTPRNDAPIALGNKPLLPTTPTSHNGDRGEAISGKQSNPAPAPDDHKSTDSGTIETPGMSPTTNPAPANNSANSPEIAATTDAANGTNAAKHGIKILFPNDLQKTENPFPVSLDSVDEIQIAFPGDSQSISVEKMGGISGFQLAVRPFSDNKAKIGIAPGSKENDVVRLEYRDGNLIFAWKGSGVDDRSMQQRIAYVLTRSVIKLNGKVAGKEANVPVTVALEPKVLDDVKLTSQDHDRKISFDFPIEGLRIVSVDGKKWPWDAPKDPSNKILASISIPFFHSDPNFNMSIPATSNPKSKPVTLKGQDYSIVISAMARNVGDQFQSFSVSADLQGIQKWKDELTTNSEYLNDAAKEFGDQADETKREIESGEGNLVNSLNKVDQKVKDDTKSKIDRIIEIAKSNPEAKITEVDEWINKYLSRNDDWKSFSDSDKGPLKKLIKMRREVNSYLLNQSNAEEMKKNADIWLADLKIVTLNTTPHQFILKYGDAIELAKNCP